MRGSVSQVASGSGGDEACHAPDTGTGRVLLRENPLLRASNEDSIALVRRRDDNQSREARRNAFYSPTRASSVSSPRLSRETRVFLESRAHGSLRPPFTAFQRASFASHASVSSPPPPLLFAPFTRFQNADSALRSRRRDFLVAQALAAATATQFLVPADTWAALENAEALPKDYAEKARAVVKALTESLEFESVGEPSAAERFRKAEPAKEAVKAFIKDWAAAPSMQGERSHDDIVLAVRQLSEFYKANGSRAALDKQTRDSVLEKLYDARDALPKAPPTLADRLLGL